MVFSRDLVARKLPLFNIKCICAFKVQGTIVLTVDHVYGIRKEMGYVSFGIMTVVANKSVRFRHHKSEVVLGACCLFWKLRSKAQSPMSHLLSNLFLLVIGKLHNSA